MGWSTRSLGSSVGLKFLTAITGVFLVLFLIAHMLGNLQVFLGPEALNAYAHKLSSLGAGLWVVRAGLFVVFALHILTAGTLQLKNWGARPIRYEQQKPLASSFASRTMIWTGLLALVFIVYHLLQFTFGTTDPTWANLVDENGHHDVYRMVIHAFQQPGVAISYIAAMFLLWFHLDHGVASLFQSLGWNAPRYEKVTERLGRTVAAILVIGNLSMPILVFLGVVGSSVGGS